MFKRPCIWQDSFEDKDRSTLQLQAVQHPTLLPAMHFTSVSHSSLLVERRQGRHFWVYCALFLMPLWLAQAVFTEPGRAGLSSAHFHQVSFPAHPTLASCSRVAELKHALPSLAAGTGQLWAKSLALEMSKDEEGTAPFSFMCNGVFEGV